MGGFSNVIGHAAGGFEQARQQDLQRQFEDVQARRAQHISLLGKLASDENISDELRQWAIQSAVEGAQAPLGKNWEPKWKEMPTPKATPGQSFTPPPAPPMTLPSPEGQTGNMISLPPSPPQTATLAPQPGSYFKSPETKAREAGLMAGSVAGSTLGGQITARQGALAGITPPLPPEEQAAFALGIPSMIGAYGAAQDIPAAQAAASGMALPPGVDPETGWVRIQRNHMGHVVAINPSVAPAAYAPTTSEGFTYQTDAAGNMVAIPVTTTRQKTTPGVSMPPPPPASVSPEKGKKVGTMKPPQALVINPPTTPGGSASAQAIRPGSPVNPRAVTAAGLSSANVPTSTIRTMAQRSQGQLSGIQDLNDEVDRLEKAGKLGPMAGRFNDFMQSKVGEGDPEYAYLNDKIQLLQTAMMLIHVGARGSTPMLLKFQHMLDSGKMDGPTLKAGIKAVREQMEQYAKEGKIPGFEGPEAPKPAEVPKSFNWGDHPVIK